MDYLLEDLAREEFQHARPMLTALVVQQGNNALPGGGFFRIASELQGKPVKSRNEWEHYRDEAWNYWKPRSAVLREAVETEHETTAVPREMRSDEPAEYSVAAYSVAAKKHEDELNSRYEKFLDRSLPVLRIRVTSKVIIEADAIDVELGRLIEAKSSSDRGYIRMAIGQLFDYERFLDSSPKLAILLPERPTEDMMELLKRHAIVVIYETLTGSFSEE
jgi:hypothetical protein